MPRRVSPFLPNQYYHFYNRGNNRQTVFFERDNYLYFLRGFKKYLSGQMDILAYCLMPTHYHLLVQVKPQQTPDGQTSDGQTSGGQTSGGQTSDGQTSDGQTSDGQTSDGQTSGGQTSGGQTSDGQTSGGQTSDGQTSDGQTSGGQTSEVLKTSEVSEVSVSRAMQKLGISYTKAINKRFERVGALFQGQFQGKPVNHYEHLLHLCIYIHANPVKDGLAALPEDWEYSNYLEWMDLRKGTLVNREFIHEHFRTSGEYEKLVREYIKTRNLPEDMGKNFEHFE